MKSSLCSNCKLIEAQMSQNIGSRTPDILVVGNYPTKFDIDKGAFRSRSASMVRQVINAAAASIPAAIRPEITYHYAVRCCPGDDKVAIETINQCRELLKIDIDRMAPKVIIALGAEAAKSFGFSSAMKDLRGRFFPMEYKHGTSHVLVTYHPAALISMPGKTTILKNDLEKAVALAANGFREIEMDLELPAEFGDVMAALDRLESVINTHWENKKSARLVSIDTETTSLNPWDKNQRMIMLSVSHSDDHGLAFPWEHRDVVYTADQFKALRHRVEEILGSDRVYVAMQNAKFDEQWLNGHEQLKTKHAGWDTMLVEHLLDEDKKNEYGLKTMTLDYFPAYGRYEQELEDIKSELIKKKEDKYKDAKKLYTDAVHRACIDYWLSLSEIERSAKISTWVNSGFLELKDADGVINLKYRKLKNEMVVLKKCEAAIVRMLKKIPDSEIDIPAELIPPEPVPEKFTYEDIPLDVLIRYAAIDALVTRKIVVAQLPRFEDDRRLISNTEKSLKRPITTFDIARTKDIITMPMCHLIGRMEFKGIKFDREKAGKYVRVLGRAIENAEEKIYDSVGYRFNPASADLGRILYEEMKLPVLKYTEKGAPSTDADTIKDLYDRHDIPFLSDLLVYRKLEKQRNTYILNWLEMSGVDGRIHGSFNQAGTATYRLSSSRPNLQNITFFVKEVPLEFLREEFPAAEKPGLNIKELFIPDDGFEFYDLDISNAEMRVLCAYSNDETLISVFNDGKCMHSLTASGISDYSYDEILANKENKETPHFQARQIGKKVNFGTIYCMSAPTLVAQLWNELRIKIDDEEAQGYLDGFFETYPGVKKYIDATRTFAGRYGFTYTFTGRRRRFPILGYNNRMANRVGRQAVNARIQTTSNDLLQLNMIDLEREFIRPNGGQMLLSVHDSMGFQLPAGATGVLDACKKIITDYVAERFTWLPVTWKFDIGKGDSYGHAHSTVD